jgi:hypothetical protein
MIITILGSCRQKPLEKYFQTTNIQEGLTYPHYSKEVVQAIEFCKGISDIPVDLTKYIFRSGLIYKNILNSSSFLHEFNRTDLFVIEIASRLSYEYKDYYAHHIAYDDGQYKIEDVHNINKRELSDDEIENDIINIKKLLNSKKILIVPHIYTHKEGKRYNLVKLLESLCNKHGVPFLDVSYEIEKRHLDVSTIYESEPLLAHFTAHGKEIVSEIYREKINIIKNTDISLESLIVYKTSQPKIRIGSHNGDGGYVIIDGLNYDCIISGGVADNIDFELEMLQKHNIPCYAYDGTITSLPNISNPNLNFINKNIGVEETENITNLYNKFDMYDNIFVKMDIETFEYRWIESLTQAHMSKIKQLVIEFHFPFTPYPFTHLDINIPVIRKLDVLKKIAQTHRLIHFHANNCCGTTHVNNTIVPNVFECTYIRNDAHKLCGLNTDSIPGPLDKANVKGKNDIHLNWPPFVFTLE